MYRIVFHQKVFLNDCKSFQRRTYFLDYHRREVGRSISEAILKSLEKVCLRYFDRKLPHDDDLFCCINEVDRFFFPEYDKCRLVFYIDPYKEDLNHNDRLVIDH
jgi:hypothetical protein